MCVCVRKCQLEKEAHHLFFRTIKHPARRERLYQGFLKIISVKENIISVKQTHDAWKLFSRHD